MRYRILVWLCLAVWGGAGLATEAVWGPVAEEVISHLEQAAIAYRQGDKDQARKAITGAYFGVFEERKMEAAMRVTLGGSHTYAVEKQFGALRKAIAKGGDPGAFQHSVATLAEALRRDAQTLDAAGVPARVYEVNQ